MKRTILLLNLLLLCGHIIANDYTKFVNPFIGTQTDDTGALSGSTFPGACVPFGMVQLCPETEYLVTWDPCSGYDYNKNRIYGITHTRLNGTGCTDLLDISLMPSTTAITPEYLSSADYSQTFSHEEEGAEPGYYWVKMKESGVKVELSATPHAGIHKYHFPKDAKKNVILDLAKMVYNGSDAYYIEEGQRSYNLLQSQLRIVDNHTIEGYRIITGWAKVRRVYFRAEFSRPFKKHMLMDGNTNVWSGKVINGTCLRAGLEFDDNDNDNEIMIKVAISAVDSEGARRNFKAECQSWNFDDYRASAHEIWKKELAKIDINGTDTEKAIFYTGLYHTMIQPNAISDVDGRYITTNYEIKKMPEGEKYYSTFSLWDTFRAAHPLYNLLDLTLTASLINSMLLHKEEYGYLPIWDLWGQENYCMIGNHAMPVISRAILTDIPGIDKEKAFKAMVESSTLSHKNSPFEIWENYGYMPEPLQSQSVSITLEQSFDDWCVYAVANKLGRKDEASRFLKRSEYYKKLFDSSIGFFAPKDEKGNWIRPFDPLGYGSNGGNPFTEGNAWQYLWFVPHNPQALISLLGGEKLFIKKLNENFTLEADNGTGNENASGFIGQYAHGNEPSHHTAYLYNFANQPWRTQELIAEIRQKFYNDKPYGYAGNDDCGQMSAWYIFSSMGFYPFNAGSDDFVIGTPLFSESVIHLPNGKTFTIRAPRKTDKAIYVKSVKLNGKPLNGLRITQSQIMEGGVLEFTMSNKK